MPGNTRRPATMLDVARRAGVSRSLVSTVFRGVPGASPETKARVLAAAAELGYRPDERARKLRSFTSTDIGIALTAVNPFHVAVTEALHEIDALQGYSLTISWTSRARSLDSAFEALLELRCAALVLMGPTESPEQLETLIRRAPEVPVVVVDRYLTLPELDTVRVDDVAGLCSAIGHLVSLGHRDITYVDGGEFVSAEPRREAYLAAMAQHGLATRIVCSGGSWADGVHAAARLLEEGPLPTAIMAYNDQVAFGIMAVLIRRGIRIPEDVSLVGFDDVAEARLPDISLTSVEQSAAVLAQATADVLLSRLNGAAAQGLRLLPPGPLAVRGSTGPPRTSDPV